MSLSYGRRLLSLDERYYQALSSRFDSVTLSCLGLRLSSSRSQRFVMFIYAPAVIYSLRTMRRFLHYRLD